jgi:hypothetical protein
MNTETAFSYSCSFVPFVDSSPFSSPASAHL